jgi:uncharacterized protein YjbI with pentapeptide repeats
MANPEHLAILKQGVEVWNRWRYENPEIGPDLYFATLWEADLLFANLREANLERAKLQGADLREAHLERANLQRAQLMKANLGGADLRGANLRKAHIERANLREANLREADLMKANLREADLRGANLGRTNLAGANLAGAILEGAILEGADLSNVDLSGRDLNGRLLRKINFTDTDLQKSDLIDANLDGATLTGVKLWESKRSGWSIKGVICEYAYFDRGCVDKKDFKPGEFERLYSDKTKIVLQYKDGITRFEVATLPMLIQFIEEKHPGCRLRWKSMQEDAGGESTTIVIEDSGGFDEKKLIEEVKWLKNEVREKEVSLMEAQSEYNGLQKFMLKALGGFSMINVNVEGNNYGPIGKNPKIKRQIIHQNDLDALSNLIPEILKARPEIEKVLTPEKMVEFDEAVEELQTQLLAKEKDHTKFQKALTATKNFITGAVSFGANCATILTSMNGITLPS